MTTYRTIEKNKLDAYLGVPTPRYACLISGEWGAGKSYFWRHYAAEIQEQGFAPVTFSVAGLHSTEDLERAFFQASISDSWVGPLAETGTLLARAALRFVKIDPNDLKLKAAVLSGKTVVCIDDLERFGGEFKTLFGFIVNLVDDDNLHCVLIADSQRAATAFDDFGSFAERIIAQTILFRPDLRAFCKDVIHGLHSNRVRDVLLENLDEISSLAERKNILNLRTIRFMLNQLNSIVDRMPQDVATTNLSSLFSAVAFYALAVGRGGVGKVELVAKAFETAGLAMSLALHRSRNPEKTEETVLSRTVNLIDDLGFSEDAYEWPTSPEMSKFVLQESVDFEQMAAEFGLLTSADSLTSDAAPMRVLQNYREHSEGEVLGAADELLSQLDNHKIPDVNEIFAAFRILYWLTKCRILDIEGDDLVERTLAVIRSYPTSSVTERGLEHWPDEYDENERRIISALEAMCERRNAAEAAERAARAREALLSDAAELPGAMDGPIFDGQDANAYLRLLKSGGASAIRRHQRFFRMRLQVTNAAQFVGEDRDFSESLAGLIECEIPAAGRLSIAQSLLRELADMLRRFVALVDTAR